jgi:hypothetical protein
MDDHAHDEESELSAEEERARRKLIELCVDIACDYGYEVDLPCEVTD